MTINRPVFTDDHFESVLKALCTDAGNDLYEHCLKAYHGLTPDEQAKFSNGDQPIRLAKTLLVAVGPERLVNNWLSESARRAVTAVRRVLNKRYWS